MIVLHEEGQVVPAERRIVVEPEGCSGQSHIISLITNIAGVDDDSSFANHKMIVPEVATRIHNGKTLNIPLEVLWTRKSAEHTPLANHVSSIKKGSYVASEHTPYQHGGEQSWNFERFELRKMVEFGMQSRPSDTHSIELMEMTSNAIDSLRDIIRQRAKRSKPLDKSNRVNRVWAQPIAIVQGDAVDMMLQRAWMGANSGHSTKSKVVSCHSPLYAEVMDEFGLTGVANYPVFMSTWWISLLMHDFDDWRQDYLAILDYNFFLEYNLDQVTGAQFLSPLGKDMAAIWDMPELSNELQIRRSHMLCSMAFFDLKRRHESDFLNQDTDGRTVWIHKDRDVWRDFKALDSAGYSHYFSYALGAPGRDDMMLAGLVNDWIDLGPDLRYQECNQSVFALTRGSLTINDLTQCYERTVWMLNASFDSEERHVGYNGIVGTCVWQLGNHRHDLWRYYSLAYDNCSVAQQLDLYKIANLADCYASDFTPRTLSDTKVISLPRKDYSYHVRVDNFEHQGSIMLHKTVCDAVKSKLIPASVIDYQIILPFLLRIGKIDEATFMRYMDRRYCNHFADIMRSGHADGFSHAYARAIAALVMEGWWSGIYFAIGIGSLIEAQPDHIANDRPH
ncbi:hypothetical protein BHYA_0049g00020 [Botrytis hyacinthi]|uniref:Uncharacterized protein n=1 Tax=Botrytis hyacinthi TaxID=278943 RepID=A0A4Z1H2S7_9HELO|nr:hypothetical protein BHYA_0049g00020 [Botrytis hyacinthi]